jgi:hypothetical protein
MTDTNQKSDEVERLEPRASGARSVRRPPRKTWPRPPSARGIRYTSALRMAGDVRAVGAAPTAYTVRTLRAAERAIAEGVSKIDADEAAYAKRRGR